VRRSFQFGDPLERACQQGFVEATGLGQVLRPSLDVAETRHAERGNQAGVWPVDYYSASRLLPERLGQDALCRRDRIPPTPRKGRDRISGHFRLLAKVLKAVQLADRIPRWRVESEVIDPQISA
jgi:hypothetical protein